MTYRPDLTYNTLPTAPFEGRELSSTGVVPHGEGRPLDVAQVEHCRLWLCAHLTLIGKGQTSSYPLKGKVERWCGAYISNGAFILAALQFGLKPIAVDSRNVTFPVKNG